MVDTDGRGLILEPQSADVQDRDGACVVLRLSRCAGMSRQGEPVQERQRMPLSTRRSFTRGTPLGLLGSSGSITFHSKPGGESSTHCKEKIFYGFMT
jgi:hypothetical protein